MTNIKTNIESVMNHKSVLLNMGLTTVAPWPHKDKRLVTLKISIDPSYIWSTDSKTVLR